MNNPTQTENDIVSSAIAALFRNGDVEVVIRGRRSLGAPGLPEATYNPGWPYRLVDNEDRRYVLLRDGTPTTLYSGATCLYGLLDDRGFIVRTHQWIPNLGSTLNNMTLTGGTWSTNEELLRYGQPPIMVPPEPVKWPS